MNLLQSTIPPALSVAVTTHNRWEQCETTLQALTAQRFRDFEVILVDDFSDVSIPKAVSQCLKSLGGRYIRHTNNRGLSEARNTAIESALGRLIAFCDDDDCWPDSMAGDLTQAMLTAPHDVALGLLLPKERERSCAKAFGTYPRLADLMREGLTPPVSSNVFKVEALKGVKGYRPDVVSGVDHDIWVSLLRLHPRAVVIWGTPPTTSTRGTGRITTDEQKRRSGIAKSLRLWAPDIENALGAAFQKHFVYSYHLYMDLFFLQKDIKRASLMGAVLRILKRPSLIPAVLRRQLARLFRRCRTAFPTFHYAK